MNPDNESGNVEIFPKVPDDGDHVDDINAGVKWLIIEQDRNDENIPKLRIRCNKARKFAMKNLRRNNFKVLPDASVNFDSEVMDNGTAAVHRPSDYQEGSILWAKLGRYPWWPCMICPHPPNETQPESSVHVRYFGEMTVGYVEKSSTMPYFGVEQYNEFVADSRRNGASNEVMAQFVVSIRQEDNWSLACEMAEKALSMTAADRLDTYRIDLKYDHRSESDCATNIKSSETRKRKASGKMFSNVSSHSNSKDVFEFETLCPARFTVVKSQLICQLCCETGHLVKSCAGNCGNTFHEKCIRIMLNFLTEGHEQQQFSIPPIDYDKCIDCNRNACRCFSCHKLVEESGSTIRCAIEQCKRSYHASCLMNGPKRNLSDESKIEILCPAHTCHSCWADDPKCVPFTNTFRRCVMCPAAFHLGDWCIPAGSIELSSLFIICPQHLEGGGNFDRYHAPFVNVIKDGCITLSKLGFRKTPYGDPDNMDLWKLKIKQSQKKPKNRSNNVFGCFCCSKNGLLLHCAKCPAGFHESCTEVDGPLPDKFICKRCAVGRYPRYGEICWIKYRNYRWWPGQICNPRHTTERTLRLSHKPGHFVVHNFGTNDYGWANRSNTYLFTNADVQISKYSQLEFLRKLLSADGHRDAVAKSLTIEDAFQLAVQIVGEAQRWHELEKCRNFSHPISYQKIDVSIPLPQHNGQTLDLSDVPLPMLSG